MKTQDWLGALKLLDRTKQLYHWYPGLWLLRAKALEGLSRYGEALEDYDTGLARVQDSDAACHRALVLYNMKNYDNAIESCDRILNDAPNETMAHVVRGISLLLVARWDEGVSSLRNAASATGELGQKVQTLIDTLQALDTRLEQFIFFVRMGAFDSARIAWRGLVGSGIREQDSSAFAAAIPQLLQPNNIAFFRQLIRESNLDETMLPITRALEYIATDDRSLIERLSAEVRPIAEEIVAEYTKRQSAKAQSPAIASPTTAP